MKKLIMLLLVITVLLAGAICAQATEQADDITHYTAFSGSGFGSLDFLVDGDLDIYETSEGPASITLENSEGIGSIYLMFDYEYGVYTITDTSTGTSINAGAEQYLHEFIDLDEAFGYVPSTVTLNFDSGSVTLGELMVFSPGQVPDSVQVWQHPWDNGADIVLFSTHGDDEQLFFAGLLPYYAVERDLRVQVVYLTNHRDRTTVRMHEMLNGLWNVGIRAYPVFGTFPDYRIDDLDITYDVYESYYKVPRESFLEFVVEQLRRFKPLVAVGHDIYGEYGHGLHRVYTDNLIKALPLINDPDSYPESAQKWGTWELPKLYLHLYWENQIEVDFDQPMEEFGGLSPFQVTQKLGYPCHKTQQWANFFYWIYGSAMEIHKADQIKDNNPEDYGLYHTTVGPDVAKNDFMENLTPYAELELLEQERLEQERLEQERLEQERLEQEQLEKEQETKPAPVTQEPATQKTIPVKLIAIIVLSIAAVIVTVIIIKLIIKQTKHDE